VLQRSIICSREKGREIYEHNAEGSPGGGNGR
jgi:hypothetical protein